jgi:ribosome-associated protein
MKTEAKGANDRQFAIELARIVADDKCEDVTVMDLRGMSPVTDYFVICSGTSDRQMRSSAEHAIAYGKKVGEPPFSHAGLESQTWILVDFVNVVLHVFAPEHRSYYDLELLWGDAPRVEWRRSATA